MIFQNLIKNSSFKDGVLTPWIGKNACILSHPCPTMTGQFSVLLKGHHVNASIEQSINVVPGESYNLAISVASNKNGISPHIKVILNYYDLSGHPIKDGINFSILKGQLPNGQSNTFKTIHQASLTVPANSYFAKLTIKKYASSYTTGVIVDHIDLIRIEDKVSLPTAYIGNTGTNTVSVVGANLNTITVGQGPVAMAQITQNNKKYIYVANEDGTVSVIQTSDYTIIETIDLPGTLSFQENRNILTSSDESTVYVANQDSSLKQGYVSVIDTATNTLTASIEVGNNPITLALTNDDQQNSGLLYVINIGSSSISVIDTSTNTVCDSFNIETNDPSYLVITLENKYFIVGYNKGDKFQVGEVSTNALIKSVSYSDDRHARSLTLSLDGTLLYVGLKLGQDANHQGSVLHSYKIYDDFSALNEIDLNKDHQSDSLMVAQYELADGYDIIYVGVASPDERYIKEILRQVDNNAMSIISEISVSNFNGFFALSSDNQYIITANPGSSSTTYIQTSSFSILETLTVQSEPNVLLILEDS